MKVFDEFATVPVEKMEKVLEKSTWNQKILDRTEETLERLKNKDVCLPRSWGK